MKADEELSKELAELIRIQVDAHNKRVQLLPSVSNLTLGEPLIPWTPTPEILAEYDRLTKEEQEASAKCRKVIAEFARRRAQSTH
jgi:hypothetical protein